MSTARGRGARRVGIWETRYRESTLPEDDTTVARVNGRPLSTDRVEAWVRDLAWGVAVTRARQQGESAQRG